MNVTPMDISRIAALFLKETATRTGWPVLVVPTQKDLEAEVTRLSCVLTDTAANISVRVRYVPETPHGELFAIDIQTEDGTPWCVTFILHGEHLFDENVLRAFYIETAVNAFWGKFNRPRKVA